MQSQVNGDIVGVIEHTVSTGLNIVDRLGYSMFGVPRLLPSTLVGETAPWRCLPHSLFATTRSPHGDRPQHQYWKDHVL